MPKRKPIFNTIYISERVQECLRPIARCALTTVVAPMGYGKTTAINWFLAEKTKGGRAVAIRMSIYSGSIPIYGEARRTRSDARGSTCWTRLTSRVTRPVPGA